MASQLFFTNHNLKWKRKKMARKDVQVGRHIAGASLTIECRSLTTRGHVQRMTRLERMRAKMAVPEVRAVWWSASGTAGSFVPSKAVSGANG